MSGSSQNLRSEMADTQFRPFIELAKLASTLNGNNFYFVPEETTSGLAIRLYGRHDTLSVTNQDNLFHLTGRVQPGRTDMETKKYMTTNYRGSLESALDTLEQSSLPEIKPLMSLQKAEIVDHILTGSPLPRNVVLRMEDVREQQKRAQKKGVLCRVARAMNICG